MITKAAEVLNGIVRRTPLLESERVNHFLGFRLLVKAECLQITGSFKIRGAYAKLSSLTDAQRKAGVVTFSSGNHGQGVAAAAASFGVPATVVMPSDAPITKLRNTQESGAHVVTYDRLTGDRAKIAQDIADKSGATVIPPYDDYVVMAGQGTIAIETIRQLSELATSLDFLVCPVGGGGLVAGIGTALAELSPLTAVCSAEPEDFDDTRRSIIARKRLENPPGGRSICDSIVTPTPGEKTFPINMKLLSLGIAVPEREVVAAMKLLAEEMKIIAEPGGAVAVAAAIAQRTKWGGKTVVAVVSGGNVDLSAWNEMVARAE